MNCEICNTKITKNLINLGYQPIPDNLSKNARLSIKKRKFKTKVDYCYKCITAFQTKVVKKKDLYTRNYGYRARNTKDVVNGLKNLSIDIKKNINKNNSSKILDIGCNDGTLLNFFYEKKFITYGIEPTDANKDCKKNHKIIKGFFDENIAKKFLKKYGKPDVIIFTNVFAHIEKLKKVLNSLKILIGKDTLVVIENHYLISVIKRFQFDTFYHEHLRTYSLNSFFNLGKILKMNIIKATFPKRYGGNIRIFYRRNISENKNIKEKIINERKIFNTLKNIFRKNLNKWKDKKKKYIKTLNKKYGPIFAKSYPARACVIINYLGLDNKNIFNIYEQDFSKKLNKYVPGTNIKIIADKYFDKNKMHIPIINFSWHISKEIKGYIRKKKIKNKIIDIVSKSDFK